MESPARPCVRGARGRGGGGWRCPCRVPAGFPRLPGCAAPAGAGVSGRHGPQHGYERACMSVCMRVCEHACACEHLHMCVCVYCACVSTCVRVSARVCVLAVSMCVCIMSICVRISMCACVLSVCVQSLAQRCMCVHVSACAWVFVCACVSTHVHGNLCLV